MIRRFGLLFLSAAILSSVFAAPVDQSGDGNVSNGGCQTAPELRLLKYDEGQVYTYQFDTHGVTKLDGISGEESRFDMRGTLALNLESGCRFVLAVQDVSLSVSAGTGTGTGQVTSTQIKDLQNTFIRFEYQDGVVSETILVSSSDAPWSLNVKRALVSLFNNQALGAGARNVSTITMPENDVSGSRCPSTYTITNGGSVFKKTRDLNRCGDRDGGWSIPQGIPYTADQEFLSDTLVRSDQTFEQDFSEGILQSASCEETHKLQLFGSDSSGAVSTVQTSLKLLAQKQNGAGKELVAELEKEVRMEPSTIYFDHTDTTVYSDETSRATISQILERLCTELSTTDGATATSTTAGLVLDLQTAFRSASSAILIKVYDELVLEHDRIPETCGGQGGHAKRLQLYLDAAAGAATTDSIVFMLLQGTGTVEMQPATEKSFYLNMVLADKPGDAALQAANNLMATKPDDMKLVLASSGLAHQFCRSKPSTLCASNEHYIKLVNAYATIASANCIAPSSDSDKMGYAITALQALGNLDVLTPQAVNAVLGCITHTQSSGRVKLHALQAFRRDPCQEKLKKAARSTLENVRLGSDLRIHGYLALTRCLTPEDSDLISGVVRQEKVEQVKSFISTHRSNMLYSSKPAMTQEQRDVYKSISEYWPSEPTFDPRKYSTFFETTSYDDDMDSGYSAESNLIYSQNSFVPRTVSSNFSVYYVGRAYNLLEVGVNLADFERYFENIFGPSSNSWDTSSPLAAPRGSAPPDLPRFDQNQYQRFRNKVMLPTPLPGSGPPVSDVYLRIFGTTIFSEAITLEDILAAQSRLISPLSFIREKFRSVLGPADLSFTQQIPLLSDELKIATISGFPLHLQYKTTALASLGWSNDISSDWRRISTSLAPSATILTRGKMSFGTLAGPLNENGLQFEMKVHHSGGVEIKSELGNGKEPGSFSYDASLKLPTDRATFLETGNEVNWISKVDGGVGDGALSKRAVTTNFPDLISRAECSSKIGQYLGLQICENAKILRPTPADENGDDFDDEPPFDFRLQPLVFGTNQVSFFLEKTDTKLDEYVLQVKYNPENTDGTFSLLLDTPGSEVNRRISVEGNLQRSKGVDGLTVRKLDLRVDTPWKKLSVSSEMKKEQGSEKESILINMDGKDYVLIRDSDLTVKVEGDNKLTMSGNLLVTYKPPEGNVVEMLNRTGTKEYTLNAGSGPLGSFNKIRTEFDIKFNFPLVQWDGQFSGNILRTTSDVPRPQVPPTPSRTSTSFEDERTYFDARTSGPSLSIKLADVTLSSSRGHFSVNGELRFAPVSERCINLTLSYGHTSVSENSLTVYADRSSSPAMRDISSQLRVESTQFSLLNVWGKWKSVLDPHKKYVLGFELVHRPKGAAGDDDDQLKFVLNVGHTVLRDGVDTKVELKVLAPFKSVDLQVDADLVTSSAKSVAEFYFKFGSILDSSTKLEIDKIGVSYELKSKHVINAKTITLDSAYDDGKWNGLLHLEPDNFYVDLSGEFDRKPNEGGYNVDNIELTLNTSALAQSKLVTFSYELESRETLTSLRKVYLDLKYGPDEIGRFLFDKKVAEIQLEAFALKLLVSSFKAGMSPTSPNEFKANFHGEWFPTKSVVNTDLVASLERDVNPRRTTLTINLKLDNGTPTYFYELRSVTACVERDCDSKNDITIHGAKSTFGLKDIESNPDLDGKPSLELSFISTTGKEYRALFSTEKKKTVFRSDNFHIWYNFDLVVDLPNRAPIQTHYIVKLQKQKLEADTQKLLVNIYYEAKYQDPKYDDVRYGFKFDTTVSLQSWNPAVLLEVKGKEVDRKLTFRVLQTPSELLDLAYESMAAKTGGKRHNIGVNVIHEAVAKYPSEMNRLAVQTSFEDHIEQLAGNADFKYKYKFVTPQRGFTIPNLEFQEDGVATWSRGGRPVFSFKSSKLIRVRKEEFYVKYEDLLDDSAYSLWGPNFEVQVIRGQEKFVSSLQVSNGKLISSSVGSGVIEDVLAFGRLEFLQTSSSSPAIELNFNASQTFSSTFYKKSSLTARYEHGGKTGSIFSAEIEAIGDDARVVIKNTANLQELSNDLTFRLNQDTQKRLFVAYKQRNLMTFAKDPNPSFEMNLQWGEDETQTLAATGTMSQADNSVNFVFDSPVLVGSPWTVHIVGPHPRSQSFSFSAESADQIVKFFVALSNKDRTTQHLTCSYEVNLQGYFDGPRSGNIDAELSQTRQISRKLMLQLIDNKNGVLTTNVSLNARTFDGLSQITVLNCGATSAIATGTCDSFEISLRGQDKYTVQVIGERSGLKTGISIDQGQKSAQVWYPSNARKQQHIGIRPTVSQQVSAADLYYTKSTEISGEPDRGLKLGLEMTLSERTIAVVFVKATWENKQADADAYELGVWLDQKRKPDERIGLGLAIISAHAQKEVDQGRTVVLQYGHPEIHRQYQKNLKVTTKYRYGITNKIFNVQTEVDIFKAAEDKFVLQAHLNHKVDEDGGTIFAIDLAATSEGQQLGFETHCTDIKQQFDEKTANCEFQLKSREKGERKFRLNYNFAGTNKFLQFGRVSTGDTLQSLVHYKQSKGDMVSVIDPFTGMNREFPNVKTEIQLPGMIDYRVNEETYNLDPFGYSLRTYPSSDPPGQYTDIWVGRLTANEYGIGFARVENGVRRNIFQVSNPQKGRLVLTLRFAWDKATIRNVLTMLQARVKATSGEMSTFVSSNENEIGASFGRVWKSVVSSLPEPENVLDWDLKELTTILEEQNVPDDVPAYLKSSMERVTQLIFTDTDSASNELVIKVGESNLRQGLSARITAYGELINGVLEGLKSALDRNVDSSNLYGQDTEDKYLTKIYEKFKALSAIRDNILELESRHAILKKIVTSVKRALLKKFQTFYKVNVDDARDMFPYPETEQFLSSWQKYTEKRLLGNDNDPMIRDDFADKLHLALQRIFEETLLLDMKFGVFQFSIPEITRTRLFRHFFKANAGPRTPPGVPLKFWINLLMNREEAIPPIDGKGLILGSSYFQTFDRVIRRFDSTCQYLLASDFVSNNFTIAIDLRLENLRATAPTRSIIFTNGHDTAILTKDNNVFINDARISLPFSSASTNVGPFNVYSDSGWTIIRGDMGVVIGCSSQMDLCVVHVSGYYFGRVRGVLGNMNNEPYDDFVLPNSGMTESTEVFLRAWKLNSDCRSQTISKYLHDIPNYVQLAKTYGFPESSK